MNTKKLRDMNLHAVADELEQLRKFKADAENQEPFIWAWQHAHGKLASDLFNSEQEVIDAWGSFSANGKPIALYARSIPSVPADNPAVAVPDDLPQRLIGRAAFLRDRGEVKTPELLLAAANAMLSTSPAPSHSQQSADAVKAFCKDIGLYDPEYDDQEYIEVSRYKLREHVESLYDRCPSHESEQGGAV